jgi:hypothetical protein
VTSHADIVPHAGERVKVNGLVLPARLVSLLATDRWHVPSDPAWLKRHVPDTDADDVVFIQLGEMRRQTASSLKMAASGQYPQMALRSSKTLGQAVDLPLLDLDYAVFIAAQVGDSALALDYRRSADNPAVVETHWEPGCDWRINTSTFDEFADLIGLPRLTAVGSTNQRWTSSLRLAYERWRTR